MILIDLETRSAVDLRDVGTRNYINHSSTHVISFVAFENDTLTVWLNRELFPSGVWAAWKKRNPVADIARSVTAHLGEECPPMVLTHDLPTLDGVLAAHNADGFDRLMWERYFGEKREWFDTLHVARSLGMPGALDKHGPGKHEGSKWLSQFYDATKKAPIRHLNSMIAYNICDVLLMRGIVAEQDTYTEPEVVAVHNAVNERGIGVDVNLVTQIIEAQHEATEKATEEIERITDGEVHRGMLRSIPQMTAWVESKGLQLPNLRQETVARLLDDWEQFADNDLLTAGSIDPAVPAVLDLRRTALRITAKKLERASLVVCDDGRLRDLFVYHGAHTGRWTSRVVQLHNMTRGIKGIDVEDILSGPVTYRRLREMYPDIPAHQILASLIRYCFIPPDGAMSMCDFSQVEARFLVWAAGQDDILETFVSGDPYKSMAAKVFNISAGEVTDEQRQIGKIISLGCGYGMSAMKFGMFCANMRIDLAAAGVTAEQCVNAFRAANWKVAGEYSGEREGHIFRKGGLWKTTYQCAERAYKTGKRQEFSKFAFYMQGGHLRLELPSGRCITYRSPKIEPVEVWWSTEPRDALTFAHVHGYRKSLYGGLLVENAVQGATRDLTAAALVESERAGLRPLMHVHDEIAAATLDIDRLSSIMSTTPDWAGDFPCEAEGFVSTRYGKQPIGMSRKEK